MKIGPPRGAVSFISYRVDGTGLWAIGARPSARQSAPVKTPKVPDIVLAASALTRTIRACGYGERTMTAYACPSIWKSSLKRPVPVSKRRSSLRSRGCPIAPIWIRLSACVAPRTAIPHMDALALSRPQMDASCRCRGSLASPPSFRGWRKEGKVSSGGALLFSPLSMSI